jgi:hypothetical protein
LLKGYVFRTVVDGAERETLVAWSETKPTAVEIRPAEKAFDYLGRQMSHPRKVELTRETVFLLLPSGGSKVLRVEPAPAKAEWRSGKTCPVVLQLIGDGDFKRSAFRLNESNELRLVAYNFADKAARGKVSVEGATGAIEEIELGPGGRAEWAIEADGPGTVTVRLDLGDLGNSIVSARVLKTTPATEPGE